MKPHQERLCPVIERMVGDMKIRHKAQATIDAYTYHVQRFARFLGKPLQQASLDDVRDFQLYLIEKCGVSWSSFNLSDMMHPFANLLQERDLVDSDRRLALDLATFSAPAPPMRRLARSDPLIQDTRRDPLIQDTRRDPLIHADPRKTLIQDTRRDPLIHADPRHPSRSADPR